MSNIATKIKIILIMSVFMMSCGQTPEDSRKELGKMNIKYSEKSFIERVKDNDILAVKLFLLAGMSPNVDDWDGIDALIQAAINDDEKNFYN